MLHLVSGDSAAGLLRLSGLPGEVAGWRDSAAVGPSPGGLPFEEYRALRAAFRGVPAESFQDVDLLARLPHEVEVVLWFDACPYDQMILVRLLAWFAAERPEQPLWLIEVGDFPGIEDFCGLGQLTPEQLAGLFLERRPVSAGQLALAARAWNAHGAADPRELARLLDSDTAALPFLSKALRRLLEELPSRENGLSRTEEEALRAAGDGRSFPEIFRAVAGMEEPHHGCWYGDLELLATLRVLAGITGAPHGTVPALREDGGRFARTGMGNALLAGEADWVEERGIDRWRGGVHLLGRDVWRWDRRAGRLVAPSLAGKDPACS
jgi:hypothetical protein